MSHLNLDIDNIIVKHIEDLKKKIELGEYANYTSYDINNTFAILLDRIKELEERIKLMENEK